jgi:hypothetical protein
MSRIPLKEWPNAEERGTRFPPIPVACPECGKHMLEDTWPPNYGGCSGSGTCEKEYGSVKCICVACRMHYTIAYRRERRKVEDGTFLGKWTVKQEERVVEKAALVERDGVWLTPHDVYREEYREEHGEYPLEAYA